MTSEPRSANANVDGGSDKVPRISILGVKVHCVDMGAALGIIRSYIGSGEPHMVVTADSYSIVTAQNDEDFRAVVNSADLVTPDSSGILTGARWLGKPLTSRASGVDIAHNLCRIAAEDDFSIFLLGAQPGVAELAAEKLKSELPGLTIAGTHHGYFPSSEDAQVAARVKDSGAKVLLLALGIPRQEKWIRAHLSDLGVYVAMGVGGSLDVFSGRVKRAPAWMQRHGLEWAYRLAMNPRKIRKVAALPQFLGLVLREKYFGARTAHEP